jgi:hypothetical protein
MACMRRRISVLRCAYSGGKSFRGCATVDKIEDAKSLELNKPQQSSTSCPHLVETEAAENRAFPREAGIRLGRRGSPWLQRQFKEALPADPSVSARELRPCLHILEVFGQGSGL